MVRELHPDLAKTAREELNEDPKQIKNDIQHLKDWISKQPYLKARTDEQWLVAILRGCKFSLERAKKKLDLYYTLRSTAPDVTLRMKPSQQNFLDFLSKGTCIILPKSNNILSPRVILIRAGAYDPNKNNVADIMCVLYYLVQILVTEDDTAAVIGTKVVVDYEGVSVSHIAQANLGLFRKMIAVSQESMPLRLKGSHHMNVSSGVELAFNIVRSLLNEKAKERFKIHKSPEELKTYISEEIIPKEYGGNGGTVAEITEYWVKKVCEYKSWMQQEEQLGTVESLRPGKPQTAEDMFGIDGSFRKLDID